MSCAVASTAGRERHVKVGVLVVAYNAETTLRWVLDRIPAPLRSELVEVLVMDDHSADATFDVAHDYVADGTDIPLTIVRHEANLGYGGNQKAGYRYAIDHGWDVVVLLHGDGQYAPEKMPDLLAPFADDGRRRRVRVADARPRRRPPRWDAAVQVRRQPDPHPHPERDRRRPASASGTPGYRAYRVSALAELPFVGNSDGFDFDTEIILQLLGARPADRRGPDPHVLRRRDLPRQRHRLRPRHRDRHGPPPPGAGRVRPRRPRAQGRAVRVQAVARQLARHRARTGPRRPCRCGCSTSAAGPGWVAAELAPPRARRHRRRPDRRRRRRRADRPLLRGRPRARPARRGRRRLRRRDRRRRDRARPQPGRAAGRPRRPHVDAPG